MWILIVGLLSNVNLLQKSDRSSENGITFPNPVKNASPFPVTIKITVFLMSSLTLIFLNLYNLWDLAPTALLSLNHTNDRYSISNQYPQTTTRQPKTDSNPVFASLRTMESKRKGLRVNFGFFPGNYLPDGQNSCYG